MKKPIQNQPLNPKSFWATQMGNKAHQIKGEGLSQGPAGHHEPKEEEWSDGNGY